jgi:hypothetical protein
MTNNNIGAAAVSNAPSVGLTDAQRQTIQAAADIAHRILCAGGDYGDELTEPGLRRELEDSRDALRAFLGRQPAAIDKTCGHRLADARNPIITAGYVCVDCGALFAAADHDKPAAPSVKQDEHGAFDPKVIAASLAPMIVEWVEGGIRMGTDWRDMAGVIEKRIKRLVSRASTSANVAQGASSHERIWLENRANIISAINAAGFELLSNKDGWWLAKRPADKAAALTANVAQGAEAHEQPTPAEYETAVDTLRHVIDCLRKNGSYTDEEGEATDYLEPLLSITAPSAQTALTDAARDVLAERKRQVNAEGWTADHDDEHDSEEMAIAAACYAESAAGFHHPSAGVPSIWPWTNRWWKPTAPRRDLVKAGALILAEVERIDRRAASRQSTDEEAKS